jgi:MOSC domain-containing protein YiiM
MPGPPQKRRKLGPRYKECAGSKKKNSPSCSFRKSCPGVRGGEWAGAAHKLPFTTLNAKARSENELASIQKRRVRRGSKHDRNAGNRATIDRRPHAGELAAVFDIRQREQMKVLSVNVALPRLVAWRGQTFNTGIFKKPVAGPVMMRKLDLDGDRQADLSVHGGAYKAVYAYPSEHYEFWRKQFPEMELPWGQFGENLTTEGLNERDTHIGDVLRVGAATVQVTQPRVPCFKLAAKFHREDILKRFLESGRSGFYVSVIEEGLVAVGDEIERIQEDENRIAVSDINKLFNHGTDTALMRRVIGLEALPLDWREHFAAHLAELER